MALQTPRKKRTRQNSNRGPPTGRAMRGSTGAGQEAEGPENRVHGKEQVGRHGQARDFSRLWATEVLRAPGKGVVAQSVGAPHGRQLGAGLQNAWSARESVLAGEPFTMSRNWLVPGGQSVCPGVRPAAPREGSRQPSAPCTPTTPVRSSRTDQPSRRSGPAGTSPPRSRGERT